jgi:DNA repair protein RadD
VLDHAGNTLTHGLPDAPRRWSLDGLGPKPPPKSRTTKAFCAACAGVLTRGADACSDCDAPVRAPAAYVQHVDGMLAEVTSEMAARMAALRSRTVSDLLREARTVDDLAAIQRARGFKPGWVWHKWQELKHAAANTEGRGPRASAVHR